MSDVIQFLENLARNPAVNKLSGANLAAELAQVDVAQRRELLDGNIDALNSLLGGRPKMMMMIWAPSEESGEDDRGEAVGLSKEAPRHN